MAAARSVTSPVNVGAGKPGSHAAGVAPASSASSTSMSVPPAPAADAAGSMMPATHMRRSTVNGDALVTDEISLDAWRDTSPRPPAFLRGWIREYYITKAYFVDRVSALIKAPGGIQDAYGFQRGSMGGAQAAVDALVADIMGGGGECVASEQLVADLHVKTFENYQLWARMVGARSVAGVDPDSATSINIGEAPADSTQTAVAVGHTAVGAPGGKPSSTSVRLYDLALYYCIKSEAANLRFMPELMCWLFHQMRFNAARVSAAELDTDRADPESSFFSRTTVAPLYAHLKSFTKRDVTVPRPVLCCCVKTGTKRMLPNSERPNYDDMNELFWRPECLHITYHSRDPAHGVQTLRPLGKTFRERSSYLAIFLSLWRWFVFLAIAFHALFVAGTKIVEAGGTNFAGIVNVDGFSTLVALTACFETQAVLQLIRTCLMLSHARCTTFKGASSINKRAEDFQLLKQFTWAFGWAAAIMALSLSGSFLSGTSLFGGPIWFIVIGARLVFMLISEGLFSSCGCTRDSRIRRFFTDLEGYNHATPAHVMKGVLGWTLMRQPVSRVCKYTLFWAPLIILKLLLDLQIITQQVNLMKTVQSATLSYQAQWNVVFLGFSHPIITIGSWPAIVMLYLLDSYIAFILGAAVVGYYTLRKDGVGNLRDSSNVKQSFLRGIGTFRRTPLAAQFVSKIMPIAAKVPGGDANQVFRRPWDQFVMSLRECDLISNEEQVRLMYGDAVLGVSNRMPLFLYAGKLRAVITQAPRIAQLAYSATGDEEFRASALPDDASEEALMEILLALPHILTLVCQSHSAIGHGDTHVYNTIRSLFTPRPGASLRETVGALLTCEGNAFETVRDLARITAQLMVEFERDAANTRLRGSPLLSTAIALLTRLHLLWNPGSRIDEDVHTQASPAAAAQPLDSTTAAHHANMGVSFAAPALERLASMAGHRQSMSRVPAVDVLPPVGRRAVPMDTRSVPGIIRLLRMPNEGSGRLDGDEDSGTQERLECLRECSRRIFYLLTMESADGSLACPEAERRLLFFINSLYMDQMPTVANVLHMPSFAVVTPQYNEPVLYDKREFLIAVNTHGVSPMVYLKSLHPHEWANFCERLGVRNESDAWKATVDAQGTAISGELEVRLWASHRGQTLARTIHGVMEYARAILLLAILQLELEYTLENEALPPASRRTRAEIEKEAIKAAQWFTAEKFRYICACQKYADHGEDDVRRRGDIDYMMMVHPLLTVVYFDNSVSALTAKRRLMSVCRNGAGIMYRLPVPGNPIADGIGEGKPENQMNAQSYVHGRVIQALDMNQDGYYEEALKIANVLAMLRLKPTTGRPVVIAGLREHIFTHALSASAYFMSQQEYLFGTMWQRVMASPLRVRMHYGHPDIMDRVFMATRGGTAKASAVVNVSEDIFAGFTAALRGGESEHIEFMQMGKGRDVGMLQIEVFESKISGGTAMSMTTRDSFRVLEAMDFSRILSFYHSSSGFYISNLLIVVSYIATLYYMAAMALTRLDAAVLSSNTVFLIGEVNAVQWFVQLGLLSIIPLGVLYSQEFGVVSAILRLIRMTLTLSPIFFMFEIQTKAYYFDAALAFGKQCYMGTGRDFVIRHVSFDDIFRSTAHSHLYLGMEALLLLMIITTCGTFQNTTIYLFFCLTGWLFTVSLLLGAFWFNPFAMELKYVKADARDWWMWLHRPEGSPDACWTAWYERESGSQYSQANLPTRLWRAVRLSRLLLLVALLSAASPALSSSPGLAVAIYAGLGFVSILVMHAMHLMTIPCPRRGASAHVHPQCFSCSSPARTVLHVLAYVALVGAAAAVPAFVGTGPAGLGDAIVGFIMFSISAWWASRIINIASFVPVAAGTRTMYKAFDFQIGIVLLAIQAFAALIVPMGSVLHTNMLFSADYADTVDVITGSRNILDRHSRRAGAKFLKVKHLGEMEFKRSAHKDAPENKIGIRRRWLRRLSQIGNTPRSSTTPQSGDVPDASRPAAAVVPAPRQGHKTLRSIMSEFQTVKPAPAAASVPPVTATAAGDGNREQTASPGVQNSTAAATSTSRTNAGAHASGAPVAPARGAAARWPFARK